MPRTCTVCIHEDRKAVDQAIIEGKSLRDIARRFRLQKDAVLRHKQQGHLPSSLVKLHAKREEARGRTLLDRVEELEAKARAILEASEAEGRHTVSLAALRELRGIVELMGRVTGELKDSGGISVNLIASPDWLRLRAVILEALAPYPETAAAVGERLQLEQK